MEPFPTPSSRAALRLAKARLEWRRAADDLLIDAIFGQLRVVRRDGDCAGRRLRQAALGGPDQDAGGIAHTKTGAQQLCAPVF